MKRPEITIIGAGLVGTLLTTLLAQRGFPVRVFERAADPRRAGFAGGRSINLALAERGLHALRQAGLADKVLEQAVMMRGRMVHERNGSTNLQAYGVNADEMIWSVSRGGLNTLLIDAAEAAGARFHFDNTLVDADIENGLLHVRDAGGEPRKLEARTIIGTDGAGSALRAAMAKVQDLGERIEPLGHGYKELEIPPLRRIASTTVLPPGLRNARHQGDRFAIAPDALHIWPRGRYMCIALPNCGGSFTVTLFLPNEGPHPSFETINDSEAALELFSEDFPDALPLMPGLAADFDAHPVGSLATLYLQKWHLGDRALLLGDAAHAIVPFHGQGMNAGFEDAAVLSPLLDAHPEDIEGVFEQFQQLRQPDADAIAAMAIENYQEMRDAVADPHYLLKRDLARSLTERCPRHFMSRYRMVTFTRLPYAYTLERGRAQDTLLERLLDGHQSLDEVNLQAAASRVRETLPPLPDAGQERIGGYIQT